MGFGFRFIRPIHSRQLNPQVAFYRQLADFHSGDSHARSRFTLGRSQLRPSRLKRVLVLGKADMLAILEAAQTTQEKTSMSISLLGPARLPARPRRVPGRSRLLQPPAAPRTSALPDLHRRVRIPHISAGQPLGEAVRNTTSREPLPRSHQ